LSETLFASCAPGAEGALAAELKRAGYEAQVERGGASFSGPTGTYAWANLWLRCAERVRLQVAKVSSPDALRGIDWRPFTGKGGTVKVEAAGAAEAVDFKRAAQKYWKASDRGWPVQLRVADGTCVVSIDSSGELLHFRGYRQELGVAPMRESLAAAMLELGGYRSEQPLCDVMCGSGTLLIEAAWVAQQRAPGAMRRFAFQNWSSFDAAVFERLPRVLPNAVTPSLHGSDLNAGALGVARRNAKRAGVQELLKLTRVDARVATPPADAGPGLVVANLPYGIRVGEKSELGELYKQLGAQLRGAFKGWRFALLLQEGSERLELPIEHTYPLENGGIACQLVVGAC
jgi:putative N6-adenine-specific DNA methylase